MAMIARHLTSWENAQTITRLKMKNSPLDAAYTALPFGVFLERIDSEEAFAEVRDMRQYEVGHDLEVGAHFGDDAQQHHAFYATKRMIANHHESAFLWNALQLVGAYVDSYAHVLQQVIGKFTTLIISCSVKQPVDLTETQIAIGQSCHAGAKETFQAQGFFQILFCNYFSHDDMPVET